MDNNRSADEAASPAIDGPSCPTNKDVNNDSGSQGASATARPSSYDYEFSDLDEITMRQLNEDILAYNYDLDYCRAQLEEADLTPQETRTLQLRTLDLGHQIRHCKHRIELIKAQSRKQTFRPSYGAMLPLTASSGSGRQPRNDGSGLGDGLAGKRTSSASAAGTGKRPMQNGSDVRGAKRMKAASSPDQQAAGGGLDEGVNTALQRLGFWKCRLCSAPKYLLAGAGRSPAAPCKWPLKDISKMITHFTEMHGEHTPEERCAELGAALSQNRTCFFSFPSIPPLPPSPPKPSLFLPSLALLQPFGWVVVGVHDRSIQKPLRDITADIVNYLPRRPV